MPSPQLDIMLTSLQKNQVFGFIVENVQQIISSEVKPFKAEIENNTVPVEPILESIRQKIVIYLNDLYVKKTLKILPAFSVMYNADKTIFFHFEVDEFCTAIGVDSLVTQDGDIIH